MSFYDEPQDPVMEEIKQTLGELIDMGMIEIIGINDQGDWLYGATPAGKEALKLWDE